MSNRRSSRIPEGLEARAAKNQDLAKIPPKFTSVNGIWGEWTAGEILSGTSPLNPSWDVKDRDLMHELNPSELNRKPAGFVIIVASVGRFFTTSRRCFDSGFSTC